MRVSCDHLGSLEGKEDQNWNDRLTQSRCWRRLLLVLKSLCSTMANKLRTVKYHETVVQQIQVVGSWAHFPTAHTLCWWLAVNMLLPHQEFCLIAFKVCKLEGGKWWSFAAKFYGTHNICPPIGTYRGSRLRRTRKGLKNWSWVLKNFNR